MMTRSIGDRNFKEGGGLSAEAEVNHYDLGEDDAFIVIASDGVWEMMSNEEVTKLVEKHTIGGTARDACEELINRATSEWATQEGDYRDDITATIIFLPCFNPAISSRSPSISSPPNALHARLQARSRNIFVEDCTPRGSHMKQREGSLGSQIDLIDFDFVELGSPLYRSGLHDRFSPTSGGMDPFVLEREGFSSSSSLDIPIDASRMSLADVAGSPSMSRSPIMSRPKTVFTEKVETLDGVPFSLLGREERELINPELAKVKEDRSVLSHAPLSSTRLSERRKSQVTTTMEDVSASGRAPRPPTVVMKGSGAADIVDVKKSNADRKTDGRKRSALTVAKHTPLQFTAEAHEAHI